MTDFDPTDPPWENAPTYAGEQEAWRVAYEEILDAAGAAHITPYQARCFLLFLVEMFNTPAFRTPGAVLSARMCFLYVEPGEA